MRRPLLLPLVAAVALVTGCSSDTDGGAAAGATSTATTTTPTTTTTATVTATASSSGGTAPAAAGCPAAGGQDGVPAGAESASTLDVDGDGRPDTVYIDDETAAGGGVVFGIQTASGGDFSTDFDSASGQEGRSVLVADVSGRGELVALASDGRAVRLYAISECSFVPVQDAEGEQYTFDLGFTGFGTGVGCVDVDGDGTRDLAGLLVDGSSITSTVVQLDGPRATNGAGATVRDASADQQELARSVTCGDLTLADDGVSTGA